MKKTIKKSKKVEVVEEVKAVIPQVAPLSMSFGQEDLNKMVDKMNEIIAFVNKMV